MCSLSARTSQAMGAGVYQGEVYVDFLVNGVWTTGVENLGRVNLVSSGSIWGQGVDIYRVYHFEAIPNKIRVNTSSNTDRFSINEVRRSTCGWQHKQASNQAS